MDLDFLGLFWNEKKSLITEEIGYLMYPYTFKPKALYYISDAIFSNFLGK